LYSACAVTLVALDTIIVLAYLLTYLLAHCTLCYWPIAVHTARDRHENDDSLIKRV